MILFYGDRVRSARLLRAINATAVAECVGWSAASQTRLESAYSQRLPSVQAVALAEVLRVPETFLSSPPSPTLAPSELLFRAPARMTKREKGYLTEYARVVGEVLDWLDKRHRLPPVKIPALRGMVDSVEAARETRKQLNLDDLQPIPHLVHTVERAGVTVVVRDASQTVGALHSVDEDAGDALARAALREDHHAYSTRVGELRDRPLVVARAHPSWERTRLTIAHEIGHLVLHGRDLPLDAEERAYEFGAELLAPRAALTAILPRPVTLAALVPIKLHFGISLGALIRHLAKSDLISVVRHGTLESQLYRRQHTETGTTWGRQEPGWDAHVPERPMLLRAWLKRCAGTVEPGAIAAGALSHVPVDLLGSMLSGQRLPSATATVRSSTQPEKAGQRSVVIDFAARKAR